MLILHISLATKFRLLAILLFLVGCHVIKGGRELQVVQRPEWVVSPERPGFISVVGYSPRQASGDKSAQYRVATVMAQRELAQIVRVRIANVSEHSLIDSNGSITSSYTDTTNLSSNAEIRMTEARVSATWVDPTDGGLFVLIEIPQ